MKRYLILFMVLVFSVALFSQTVDPRPPRTTWKKELDYIKNGSYTMTYKTLTSPTFGGTITSTAPIDQTITGVAAAGDKAVNTSITQGTSALTGNLIAGAFVATNGTAAAANGVVYGIEAKARAATPAGAGNTIGRLTGVYASVDAKAKTATTMRAFEASLDGAAGGTSTEAVAFEAFNNSSATQTASYAFSANGGTASGHKAYTADFRMQNGALLDNATNNAIKITENSEDLVLTFGTNTAAFTSTTGLVSTTFSLDNAGTNIAKRALVGAVTASGTGMTTSYLATGVRGEATVTGSTSGQAYIYGTQGKLIMNGGTLNGGSFNAAVVAQLDLATASTYTSVGSLSALWVDAGATAHSSANTAAPTMIDMIHVTNTAVGLLPRAVLNVQAYATHFLSVKNGDGATSGWLALGGSDCTASGAQDPLGTIKVDFNGTPGYIRVWAAQ